MPVATLPRISWPTTWKSASEMLPPAVTSGRTNVITIAITTTTTTSEAMMKASEKVATGPLARVCERMPRQAEGLRLIASVPQSKARPINGTNSSLLREGNVGREQDEGGGNQHHHHHALRGKGPGHAARDLSQRRYAELGAARQRDQGQRQRVDLGQLRDGVVIDEVEHVRTADDARQQVAGEVRQAERLEQLAQQGAAEQQEADRGNLFQPRRELRAKARRPVQEAEHDRERQRLDQAGDDAFGCRARAVAHGALRRSFFW